MGRGSSGVKSTNSKGTGKLNAPVSFEPKDLPQLRGKSDSEIKQAEDIRMQIIREGLIEAQSFQGYYTDRKVANFAQRATVEEKEKYVEKAATQYAEKSARKGTDSYQRNYQFQHDKLTNMLNEINTQVGNLKKWALDKKKDADFYINFNKNKSENMKKLSKVIEAPHKTLYSEV